MPELIWQGTGVMTEQPNSPVWRFGETVSATVTYRGQWEIAKESAPRKGVLGTGDFAGLKVSESTVQRERGGIGLLTVVFEGVPAGDDETQVPPDKTVIEYSEEPIALEKHVKFAALSANDVRAAYAWAAAKTDEEIAATEWIFLTGSTELQELAERLNRGVEQFPLGLPVYRFTSYYNTEPETDAGGYPDTPFGSATPPPGYDWLRKPDSLAEEGNGYWALTRTWQGTYNLDVYLYE